MRFLIPCCLLIGYPLHAAEWHSTAGSEFGFEAVIEGAATPGTFHTFDVELDFDPAEPAAGRLHVTVDLHDADMGDPDMNAVLFDPAWFGVERYPEAVFESCDISQSAPHRFVATGRLTLKGTTKPVAVPFSWQASGERASMHGELVLSRGVFDVGSGEWADGDTIGSDVHLSFDVQLVSGTR